MNCSRLIALLFVLVHAAGYAAPLNDWTVLFYLEVAEGLSDMAFKNISDMARACKEGGAPNTTVLVQVHSVPQEGSLGREAYRYSLEQGSLTFIENTELSYNTEADLVDAMRAAVAHAPAKNYMIIIGSHGYGILDPYFDEESGEWHVGDDTILVADACPLRAVSVEAMRGSMVQKSPAVFMSSTQLQDALATISTQVLDGKKVAILGLDMCKQAMLEVGYMLAPYVDYLTGSQDCELRYGWDYYRIFKEFNTSNRRSDEIVRSVVEAYESFYNEHAPKGTYTQSALSLGDMPALKQNVDAVCKQLLTLSKEYEPLLPALIQARKQMPAFCDAVTYIDLQTLYKMLHEVVAEVCAGDERIEQFSCLLAQGYALMRKAVVANCAGDIRPYAHGISIYFPLSHIDASYPTTSFPQESAWYEFLTQITAHAIAG